MQFVKLRGSGASALCDALPFEINNENDSPLIVLIVQNLITLRVAQSAEG